METYGRSERVKASDKGEGDRGRAGGGDHSDGAVRPGEDAHAAGDGDAPEGRAEPEVQRGLARVRGAQLRVLRHLRGQPLHVLLHRPVRLPGLQDRQERLIHCHPYHTTLTTTTYHHLPPMPSAHHYLLMSRTQAAHSTFTAASNEITLLQLKDSHLHSAIRSLRHRLAAKPTSAQEQQAPPAVSQQHEEELAVAQRSVLQLQQQKKTLQREQSEMQERVRQMCEEWSGREQQLGTTMQDWQDRAREAQARLRTTEQHLNEAKRMLSQETKKAAVLQAQLEAHLQGSRQREEDRRTQSRAVLQVSQKELHEAMEAGRSAEEETHQWRGEALRLQQQLEQLQAAHGQDKDALLTTQMSLTRLTNTAQQLQAQVQLRDRQIGQLQSETQGEARVLREQIEVTGSRLTLSEESRSLLQRQLGEASLEVSQVRRKLALAEAELTEVRSSREHSVPSEWQEERRQLLAELQSERKHRKDEQDRMHLQMSEADSRRKQLGQEVQLLEGQLKQAEGQWRLKEALSEQTLQVVRGDLEEAINRAQALEAEREELGQSLAVKNNEVENIIKLNHHLDEQNQGNIRTIEALREQLRQERAGTQKDADGWSQQRNQLLQRVQQVQRSHRQAQREKELLVEGSESAQSESRREVDELTGELDRARRRAALAEQEMGALESSHQQQSEQLKQLQQQLATAQHSLGLAEEEQHSLAVQNQRLSCGQSELATANHQQRQHANDLLHELTTLQQQHQTLHVEHQSALGALQDYHQRGQRIKQLTEQVARLEEEVSSQQQQLQEAARKREGGGRSPTRAKSRVSSREGSPVIQVRYTDLREEYEDPEDKIRDQKRVIDELLTFNKAREEELKRAEAAAQEAASQLEKQAAGHRRELQRLEQYSESQQQQLSRAKATHQQQSQLQREKAEAELQRARQEAEGQALKMRRSMDQSQSRVQELSQALQQAQGDLRSREREVKAREKDTEEERKQRERSASQAAEERMRRDQAQKQVVQLEAEVAELRRLREKSTPTTPSKPTRPHRQGSHSQEQLSASQQEQEGEARSLRETVEALRHQLRQKESEQQSMRAQLQASEAERERRESELSEKALEQDCLWLQLEQLKRENHRLRKDHDSVNLTQQVGTTEPAPIEQPEEKPPRVSSSLPKVEQPGTLRARQGRLRMDRTFSHSFASSPSPPARSPASALSASQGLAAVGEREEGLEHEAIGDLPKSTSSIMLQSELDQAISDSEEREMGKSGTKGAEEGASEASRQLSSYSSSSHKEAEDKYKTRMKNSKLMAKLTRKKK